MTPFVEFLAGLPASKLDRLYASPWTCQAVLRSLPPVAKQYVLRVLFLETPLAESLMADWCLPTEAAKHHAAMSSLQQMRVLLPSKSSGSEFVLNPPFREQLLSAVVSGASAHPRPTPASSRRVGEAELDSFARSQWEAVLLHLTSAGGGPNPQGSVFPGRSFRQSPLVKSIFRRAGLLPAIAGQQESTERFGFLLKDSSEQLWVVISNYVVVCEEEKHLDSAELLAFLLELGFHTPGMRYSMSEIPQWQQSVLEELSSLGLVLLQKGTKDRYFVPTNLAAALSASLSKSSELGSSKGFVLVETNFKVYAHTGSQFQAEVLGLFMRVEMRLPNLTVGECSRETCMRAFDAGITADQIVQYMRKHAHPHVASRTPVVPETVVDQIRLWEFDRNRIALRTSVLYDDFPSQDSFDAAVAHARERGGLLWHDPTSRKFVVDEGCHESIKNFLRKIPAPKKK